MAVTGVLLTCRLPTHPIRFRVFCKLGVWSVGETIKKGSYKVPLGLVSLMVLYSTKCSYCEELVEIVETFCYTKQ